jgi:hypothetical protein
MSSNGVFGVGVSVGGAGGSHDTMTLTGARPSFPPVRHPRLLLPWRPHVDPPAFATALAAFRTPGTSVSSGYPETSISAWCRHESFKQ